MPTTFRQPIGLKAALSNIGDAKNMLAVAESGLQQISDILTEMKGKATQAASDTLGVNERDAIKTQLESLSKQISDIRKRHSGMTQTCWTERLARLCKREQAARTQLAGHWISNMTRFHWAWRLG